MEKLVSDIGKKHGINTSSIIKQIREKDIQQDGKVNCDVLRRGQTIEDDDNAIRILVSKGRSTIGNMLSPFNIEVDSEFLPYKDMDPVPMELWWQSAKMKGDESMKAFERRRLAIYESGVAKRKYFDLKKDGVKGALFDDTIYQYVDSRYFYCKMYQHSLQRNPAYLFLRDLHLKGFNLLLMGPDGHPMSGNATEDYVDTSKQFGHERVLVCMLLGLTPWEEYAETNTQVPYPKWIRQL